MDERETGGEDGSSRNEAERIFIERVVNASSPASIAALVAEYPELETELRTLHQDWEAAMGALGGAMPSTVLVSAESERVASAGAGTWDEFLDRLRRRVDVAQRYVLKGEIARGGMGVVHRIYDTDLKRPLAMKVILGSGDAARTGQTPAVDPKTLGRFIDEAQITGQLDHPGIVPVHEVGVDNQGRVFFTMKLVKGEELTRVIERLHAGDKEVTLPRVLGILLRVCEALSYAHEKGVIHRDLKPSNIMVGRHGEVYVMDWGLARVLDDATGAAPPDRREPDSFVASERRRAAEATPGASLLTRDGDVVGTPAYMAPEQALGDGSEVGPRADVYSVGAILYHVLTGSPPYHQPDARLSPQAVLALVAQGPPTPISRCDKKIPPEIVSLCQKSVSRNAEERYQSAEELGVDIRAFLENRVVRAHSVGAIAEARAWTRRNSVAATTITIAAIGLGSVTGLFVSGMKARGDSLAKRNKELEAVTAQLESSNYVANVRGSASAIAIGDISVARLHLDVVPRDRRGWEWHYLATLCDDSVTRLNLEHQVRAVSWSTSGLDVLCSTYDGRLRLVAVGSGSVRRSLQTGAGRSVGHLEQSKDGLWSAGIDRGVLIIWNMNTGSVYKRLSVRALLRKGKATGDRSSWHISALCFDEDSNSLSVALVMSGGGVSYSDFGGPSDTLVHPARIRKATVGLSEFGIRVGPEIELGSCRRVAIRSDSSVLAVALKGGVVELWDGDLGQRIRRIDTDPESASLHPSAGEGDISYFGYDQGARFLIACIGNVVRAWSVADWGESTLFSRVNELIGGEVLEVGCSGAVIVVSYLSDEGVVGGVVYDTGLDRTIRHDGIFERYSSFAIDSSGSRLAVGYNNGDVRIYNAMRTDQPCKVAWDVGQVHDLAIARDKTVIYAEIAGFGRDLAIRSCGGDLLARFSADVPGIESVALSRDGKTLVLLEQSGSIHLWTYEFGWELIDRAALSLADRTYAPPTRRVALSALGSRFAIEEGGVVLLFDVTSKCLVSKKHMSGRDLGSLWVSSNGMTCVAYESGLGELVVWDVMSGDIRRIDLFGITAECRESDSALACLSPDGARVAIAFNNCESASGGCPVVVCDAVSGECLLTMSAPGWLVSLEWSECGDLLVAADEKGNIWSWGGGPGARDFQASKQIASLYSWPRVRGHITRSVWPDLIRASIVDDPSIVDSERESCMQVLDASGRFVAYNLSDSSYRISCQADLSGYDYVTALRYSDACEGMGFVSSDFYLSRAAALYRCGRITESCSALRDLVLLEGGVYARQGLPHESGAWGVDVLCWSALCELASGDKSAARNRVIRAIGLVSSRDSNMVKDLLRETCVVLGVDSRWVDR